MIHKKTKLVLAIATASFALAATVTAPEAAAHYSKKKHFHDVHYYGNKHKHKKVRKARRVYREPSEPVSSAPVAAAPVAAAAYDDSALKQRIADLESRPAPVAKESKDNMVFFRGGYARSDAKRNGVSIQTKSLAANGLQGERADRDAWYIGAGLDFSVDDNLFGLMDNTEVLAEVMFQYKEFNNVVRGNALTYTGNANGIYPGQATVSAFGLSASPKIKFLKGSDFRPWVIPVGMAINVISPPSESITVLEPSFMFGVGADYKVWKNIYVGVDARYQYALGTLDRVRTDGMTAGGYIGLGF